MSWLAGWHRVSAAMAPGERVVFAVGSSWLNRLVAVATNLVLLPIYFRYLDRELLGLWFLLGSTQGLVALIGFAVPATLQRHVALAVGRDREGAVANLVATGSRVLAGLALGGTALAWVAGAVFFLLLDVDSVAIGEVLAAWTAMCAGFALSVAMGWLAALLQGLGYVGQEMMLQTGAAVVVFGANVAVAVLGGGLLELALVFLGGILLQRLLLARVVRGFVPGRMRGRGRFDWGVAIDLARPAFLAWLTLLGTFLLYRTSAVFIAALRDATDIPAYHALFTLNWNLGLLAGSFAVNMAVFISQAWGAGDGVRARRYTYRAARLGLLVMVAGIAVILGTGPALFDMWLGPGNYLGPAMVMGVGLMVLLELQGGILSTCARATEDERYAGWSLAAGVLAVILIPVLMGAFGLGGLVVAILLAQGMTMNWYAVLRPFRRLGLSPFVYTRTVALPVLLAGGLVYTGARLGIVAGGGGGVVALVLGLAGGAMCLAVAAAAGLVRREEWRAAAGLLGGRFR